MSASGRSQPEARPISAPEPGAFRLLLGHWETFLPPNRVHTIVAHAPPLLPQEIRDRTGPIPPICLGERNDSLAHRLLTRVQPWPVSIGGPELADRPTRSTRRHVEHGDGVSHGFTLAGRA